MKVLRHDIFDIKSFNKKLEKIKNDLSKIDVNRSSQLLWYHKKEWIELSNEEIEILEDNIHEDFYYSYFYAINNIEKRFKKAEKYIYQSEYCDSYRKFFDIPIAEFNDKTGYF